LPIIGVTCTTPPFVCQVRPGVLLAAHHSRDTAAKQWSETRALALLGLGRLLRTAATSRAAPAFLAAAADANAASADVGARVGPAPWFNEVWRTSLALAAGAALQGSAEQEAALAGLGLLIGMCKLSAAKGLPQDPVTHTILLTMHLTSPMGSVRISEQV
jgi:hypothetical protein